MGKSKQQSEQIERERLFDKTLRAYQRLSLFLLYPALASLVMCSISLFNGAQFYHAAFSSMRAISLAMMANPISGDIMITRVVIFFILAVMTIGMGYFAMMAAKGKFWALIVGISIYLLDFILIFFFIPNASIFPNMGLDLSTFLVMGIFHLIFLILDTLAVLKYAKLLRLQKGNAQ
ncbi:MAG: hypothetical protein K5694_03300 [Bacilli bacterium]|nr:hypothetical protein [Bacilli bacterium]